MAMMASKTFLLCTLPRSGSNLLADALRSTNLCGRPVEYFNPDYESGFARSWNMADGFTLAAYTRCAIENNTTPNGVFGAKLHWSQLRSLIARIRAMPWTREISPLQSFLELFPEVRYVFLTRRDKVRQAVSYSRALQTLEWWKIDGIQDPRRRDVDARYDRTQIAQLLEALQRHEQHWEEFFSLRDIRPLRFTYEDLVLDAAVRSILDLLEITPLVPPRVAPPRLQRQADEITEQWVRDFNASTPAASEPGTDERTAHGN